MELEVVRFMDDEKFKNFELQARASTLLDIVKEIVDVLNTEMSFLTQFLTDLKKESSLESTKIKQYEEIEKRVGLVFRAYEKSYEKH